MTISEITDTIDALWKEESATDLELSTILKYLKISIRHVENIDYPKGNTFSVSGNTIVFDTTPTDASCMLYIYYTLKAMGQALVNGKLLDDKLGVTWRSGMESMSTSAAANVSKEILASFKDTYVSALKRVKINTLTITEIDLYDE